MVLHHLGDVPRDSYLVKAVQEQRAVVDAYPRSPAGNAFMRIAKRIETLPAPRETSGGIEFFFERLLMAEQQGRGMVA